MERVRIETVVQPNGRIVIDDLPFDEGETVEVVVVSEGNIDKHPATDRYPFRGATPYRFDDPFGPATPVEDWEALK